MRGNGGRGGGLGGGVFCVAPVGACLYTGCPLCGQTFKEVADTPVGTFCPDGWIGGGMGGLG